MLKSPICYLEERSCVVTAKDNHNFLSAVFWILKTGALWKDLPERFLWFMQEHGHSFQDLRKGDLRPPQFLYQIIAQQPDFHLIRIYSFCNECQTFDKI